MCASVVPPSPLCLVEDVATARNAEEPIHSPWLIGMGERLLASGEHADHVAAWTTDFMAAGQLLACHVAQAVRDLDLLPAPMVFRPAEEQGWGIGACICCVIPPWPQSATAEEQGWGIGACIPSQSTSWSIPL